MKVRNILVTNREMFEAILIRELIEKEISYVKIEHEFHFLDSIIRLYDKKIDEETMCTFIHLTESPLLSSLNEAFSDTEQDKQFITCPLELKNNSKPQKSVSFNKTSIKRNNQETKQKLKRFSR